MMRPVQFPLHAAVITKDRERVLNYRTVLVIGDSIAAVSATEISPAYTGRE